MAGYWRYVAVVEGSGTFPLDMLRYDRCSPYEQEDVARMGSHSMETRRVQVVKYHPSRHVHPYTEARWASFGWNVITQEAPVNLS